MTRFLRRVLADERGATAVEYGLIVSLIAVTALVAIILVANKTNVMWNLVATTVNAA